MTCDTTSHINTAPDSIRTTQNKMFDSTLPLSASLIYLHVQWLRLQAPFKLEYSIDYTSPIGSWQYNGTTQGRRS